MIGNMLLGWSVAVATFIFGIIIIIKGVKLVIDEKHNFDSVLKYSIVILGGLFVMAMGVCFFVLTSETPTNKVENMNMRYTEVGEIIEIEGKEYIIIDDKVYEEK